MFENALTGSLVSIQGFLIDNDLWFEPKHGLNVIYGKNGVGKSTLINFIEAIATRPIVSREWDIAETRNADNAQVARSDAERGIGRVLVRFTGPGIVDMADDLAQEMRKINRFGPGISPAGHRWRSFVGESERVAAYLVESKDRDTRW
jgi:energy-coupling factor transporter ATP-binding protein EcfA2